MSISYASAPVASSSRSTGCSLVRGHYAVDRGQARVYQTWAIIVQRHHAVTQRLRASDTVNFRGAHVILDTRPSLFSACNIEKVGVAWGRGY